MILFLFFGRCLELPGKEAIEAKNNRGQVFAGSATCQKCHKSICDSFVFTSHFLTSRPAVKPYLKGSFHLDSNTYTYSSGDQVKMEKRGSAFFQVKYVQGNRIESHKMDIVVGSGTKGQSFITQNHNRLFQLPITYFTAANAWSNSPGYPNKVLFSRPITARCMECHSTYLKPLTEPLTDSNKIPNLEPEKFDISNMIYGVNCEKCHGPGKDHVVFHLQNPSVKLARFIINPNKISRIQSLEFCASCHGGKLKKIQPSFSFQVGDRLSTYFSQDTMPPDPKKIDVHGNQYGLLQASKCFVRSSSLTCNSCHNSHANERGNLAVFSSRCMSCHELPNHQKVCKLTARIGTAIKYDCISCHMPLKPSKAIAVFLNQDTVATAALIRSHYIKIYPQESEKILAFLGK